jgi:hypothetical protein
VNITVPGAEIVVSSEPHAAHEHEDAYVAVRDAFSAVARRLEDYARRRRGATKTHDVPLHGRVAELFPRRGYGFHVIDRERERCLERRAVQVQHHRAGHSGGGERVRHHTRAEGVSRPGPPVLTGVPEVGDHTHDARSSGAPARVREEQELDQILADGWAGRLDQEHGTPANVIFDAYMAFTVKEPLDVSLELRDAEALGQIRGQPPNRRAGEQSRFHDHPP